MRRWCVCGTSLFDSLVSIYGSLSLPGIIILINQWQLYDFPSKMTCISMLATLDAGAADCLIQEYMVSSVLIPLTGF